MKLIKRLILEKEVIDDDTAVYYINDLDNNNVIRMDAMRFKYRGRDNITQEEIVVDTVESVDSTRFLGILNCKCIKDYDVSKFNSNGDLIDKKDILRDPYNLAYTSESKKIRAALERFKKDNDSLEERKFYLFVKKESLVLLNATELIERYKSIKASEKLQRDIILKQRGFYNGLDVCATIINLRLENSKFVKKECDYLFFIVSYGDKFYIIEETGSFCCNKRLIYDNSIRFSAGYDYTRFDTYEEAYKKLDDISDKLPRESILYTEFKRITEDPDDIKNAIVNSHFTLDVMEAIHSSNKDEGKIYEFTDDSGTCHFYKEDYSVENGYIIFE